MAVIPNKTSQACTLTSIEGRETRKPLPHPDNKPYLMEKAEYGARFPRIAIRKNKNGSTSNIELKQLVMSGLIKADEFRHDFRWNYKAEVSFDMSYLPPKPFLSTSAFTSGKPLDPDRRHTMTFFPKGRTKKLLRRPDVIIVKDRSIRWPALAGTDHEDEPHPDNLERLVEVKFPGDELLPEQEQAYLDICGGQERFSVLEIHDCRDDEDRERDKEFNKENKPTRARDSSKWELPLLPNPPSRPAPVPVPAYGPEPTPRPALVESWTQQVQTAVDGLLEQGAQGIRQLSEEVKKHLNEVSIWVGSKGEWVRRESQKAWEWVSESGGQILRWTDDQLRAMWQEVQKYTDLTLEALKNVDWVQVLIDLGKAAATAVVLIVIGELIVAAAIPATVMAALLVIVRLAQFAWALLATILTKVATSPLLLSH
ncbi:nuclease [Pseudomonas chlororaphis]|uniref:Nuclease n=1 Tax=Pseudomonas chlororaphis TaxID=587753 RepID=A0A0A6D5K0_9PSED|nr:nuclease [Pseudomonas chlororaphis]